MAKRLSVSIFTPLVFDFNPLISRPRNVNIKGLQFQLKFLFFFFFIRPSSHPSPPPLPYKKQTFKMKITALVSLAAALLVFADASPIARRPHHEHKRSGHAVPLTRNPHFKHNTKAQMAKLNKRYPGINILASGTVPLTDAPTDLEYYGTVSIGTPAQNVKLDFDTVRPPSNWLSISIFMEGPYLHSPSNAIFIRYLLFPLLKQ